MEAYWHYSACRYNTRNREETMKKKRNNTTEEKIIAEIFACYYHLKFMTLTEYFLKMKGGATSPPGGPAHDFIWSWVGSLMGIGLCSYLSARYLEPRDLSLIIGSFGASAVLVYSAIKSPLAQPRNL